MKIHGVHISKESEPCKEDVVVMLKKALKCNVCAISKGTCHYYVIRNLTRLEGHLIEENGDYGTSNRINDGADLVLYKI